ncbi:programmed cell death protein 2 [Polychytrium aggregatum]|uniref:programmed cell death protein 2 n=1 Tax=Polychytrium aggregatum TaxID=110093 RepID=UPI0022FE88E3|nr:programmed cell death protein 2 [Polychytrium aggregatum]KAI9203478.1 programmed cell death protein 2 [Polychytrium aggregatum]
MASPHNSPGKDTSTPLQLAFPSDDLSVDQDSDPYADKLGGVPVWFDSNILPDPEWARCGICGEPLHLVTQILAQLPSKSNQHDRVFYIFGCNKRACSIQPQSWKAIRSIKALKPKPKKKNKTPKKPNGKQGPGKNAIPIDSIPADGSQPSSLTNQTPKKSKSNAHSATPKSIQKKPNTYSTPSGGDSRSNRTPIATPVFGQEDDPWGPTAMTSEPAFGGPRSPMPTFGSNPISPSNRVLSTPTKRPTKPSSPSITPSSEISDLLTTRDQKYAWLDEPEVQNALPKQPDFNQPDDEDEDNEIAAKVVGVASTKDQPVATLTPKKPKSRKRGKKKGVDQTPKPSEQHSKAPEETDPAPSPHNQLEPQSQPSPAAEDVPEAPLHVADSDVKSDGEYSQPEPHGPQLSIEELRERWQHPRPFPACYLEFAHESQGEQNYDYEMFLLAQYRKSEECSELDDALLLQSMEKEGLLDASEGAGGGGGWGGEAYEKMKGPKGFNKAFKKFIKIVAEEPEQCIRYGFQGDPLYYSNDETWSKLTKEGPPPCPKCKEPRTFEFQLMPAILSVLPTERFATEHLDTTVGAGPKAKDPKAASRAPDRPDLDAFLSQYALGMEWGTVLIFSCSKDCDGFDHAKDDECSGRVAFFEEHIVVQRESIDGAA